MNDSSDRQASIRDRRVQYESDGFDIADVAADPIEQWHRWHAGAFEAGVTEPNAMTLSTVDEGGVPDARIVLVRDVDRDGFTFFTHYESAKSRQLETNPAAAATFSWMDLHQSVRVRGRVERVSAAASDAYFATRPRESQIGAWASPQSQPIDGRAELDRLVSAQNDRLADLAEIPRPPFWGGWRIVHDELEFWQGRPSRLHDRLLYRLVEGRWEIVRLAP